VIQTPTPGLGEAGGVGWTEGVARKLDRIGAVHRHKSLVLETFEFSDRTGSPTTICCPRIATGG
jgi:hypothetical protein